MIPRLRGRSTELGKGILMRLRKPMVIVASTVTLVLGTAVAAFADTSTGQGLAVGGNNCAGPVVVDSGQSAGEGGQAFEHDTTDPVSVRWSIWENSTNDLDTATRVLATEATAVIQYATNNSGSALYYWGCLFNNSTVEVDYTVTINSTS
jgi:hypothetical protein